MSHHQSITTRDATGQIAGVSVVFNFTSPDDEALDDLLGALDHMCEVSSSCDDDDRRTRALAPMLATVQVAMNLPVDVPEWMSALPADDELQTFSGDWLVDHTSDVPYSIGYRGELAWRWSGGCAFRVTRQVAERIVRDQPNANSDHVLVWSGEALVYIPSDEPGNVEVIQPDDAGRYIIGFGWTWAEVDAAACAEIVG